MLKELERLCWKARLKWGGRFHPAEPVRYEAQLLIVGPVDKFSGLGGDAIVDLLHELAWVHPFNDVLGIYGVRSDEERQRANWQCEVVARLYDAVRHNNRPVGRKKG
ncbi:MAG: hypothetical protein WBG15_21960, partial [Xanthobacteraceae bacterium]